jgi:hypothetical protein
MKLGGRGREIIRMVAGVGQAGREKGRELGSFRRRARARLQYSDC